MGAMFALEVTSDPHYTRMTDSAAVCSQWSGFTIHAPVITQVRSMISWYDHSRKGVQTTSMGGLCAHSLISTLWTLSTRQRFGPTSEKKISSGMYAPR